VARDLASGSERNLWTVPEGHAIQIPYGGFMPSFGLTRDGRELLFFESDPDLREGVRALDVERGTVRSLAVPPGSTQTPRRSTNLKALGFSPDGAAAYLATRIAPGMDPKWMRVPLDGSPRIEFELPAGGFRQVSPDGTRLLFVGGSLTAEVWVMIGAPFGSAPEDQADGSTTRPGA
jgi:hypothetical protein